MKPRTISLLQVIENTGWFTSVGQKGISNVIYVKSWLEAVANCVGPVWSDVHLEANNILGGRVLSKSQPRYNQWNEVVAMVKPPVLELTKRKTAAIMAAEKLPKEFWWSVSADIIGAAMECEYADIVEPEFFNTIIIPRYLKGHFPCGWEGDFPAGRLIVY
jgi:hypothetical protein